MKPIKKRRFKTAKMFRINGAWYAATTYSARLLKQAGLPTGGFLVLSVVANDMAKHGMCVTAVPEGGSRE